MCHYAGGVVRECRDLGEACSDESVLDTGRVRFVPLSPFVMPETGKHFFASSQSEEGALQVMIENELRKKSWDPMFLEAKQKRDYLRALVGNMGTVHRLK